MFHGDVGWVGLGDFEMNGCCRCGFADEEVDALELEGGSRVVREGFVEGPVARQVLEGL